MDIKQPGFLGSFLSKGLKTNQLELNTDEKTLRPIARLKEPRDLFALPKDKDHDFAQQAPRWPIECQVIEERILHIPYVQTRPEPYNTSVGELKPRPVGEENGIVVFNYNPISAVNYVKPKPQVFRESSDSDISSSESRGSSPDCGVSNRSKLTLKTGFSKLLSGLHRRSSSNSNEEYDEDDDDDEEDDNENDEDDIETILKTVIGNGLCTGERKKERSKSVSKDKERSKSVAKNKERSKSKDINNNDRDGGEEISTNATTSETLTTITTTTSDDIDDIWANNSPEFSPATPTFIKSCFGHEPKSGSPVNESMKTVRVESSQSTDAGGGGDMGACGDGDRDQTVDIDNTKTFHKTTKSPNQTPQTAQPETKTEKTKATETVIEPKPNESKKFNTEILKLNEEILEIIESLHTEKEVKEGQQREQNQKPYCEINLESMIVTPIKVVGAGKTKFTNATPRLAGGDDSSTLNKTANVQNIAHKINNNIAPDKIKLYSEDTKDAPETESDKLNNTDSLSPPQFSRSAVGGSKILTNCHPYNPEELECLEFESRFESGNLAKAVKITTTYYELYLRSDLYTSRSKQWFYFRVRKMQKGLVYRFSIVNLVKSDSLYNDGMRPLMYSCIRAKQLKEGWRRCGENICYYRNEEDNVSGDEDEENSSYTLTFNIEFFHDDDTVYFAHSYPYTYSDLQDYLMDIQKHPVKSKFCKLRMLCRSLAGNNVYYLTVTAPTKDEEAMKRKKSIVVSARVHPSETPASWMMKGLMDFITGDSVVAKRLRHKFIFKLIPMLNPDGVIVGNTRNSLTGKDLNRQYRTVIRETYPSIWYTKAMIKRLIDECGVAMYCDMHAHSRKHNIFIYGCENKRDSEKKLMEQVFPLMMHKNIADKFSFESSKFKVQRNKEGTGRIVVWMLGITNSYTIEASFGGSSLGLRKGTHFNTADYEHIGRGFCETLLDYSDDHPNKVKRIAKIFKQIKKIRRREKHDKKALKLKKMAEEERLRLKIIERLLKEGSSADEPLNIPLSDYSSDEGRCSSNSGNEGSSSMKYSDFEGPCCAPLKAPPSSPEVYASEKRRFYFKRMRKVLRELDRIYFQPLYHKKYQAFLNYKLKKQRIPKKEGRKIEPPKLPVVEVDAKENDPNDFRKQVSQNQTTNLSENINKNMLKNQNQSQALNPMENLQEADQIQDPKPVMVRKVKRKVKEKKDPLAVIIERRPKVSRKFRLFLASRNIMIYRKPKRKNRRTKLIKQSRLNKEAQRAPLDLPTTDPGSDIHFSTDEEELCGDAANNNSVNPTAPRSRKILMQSELQRRYIEEIGDGSAILKRMPPELIVTSPSKPAKFSTPSSGMGALQKPPTTAPVGDKFPRISAGADLSKSRRTNSWHNLHRSAGKAVPKIRLQNQHANPLDVFNNKDELQLKLSLKKKIWSGLSPEPPSWMERNRPLSWGMPPMTQVSALYKTEKVTTRTIHSKNRDHNEALLSACTEKLLAWQQVSSTTTNMPGTVTSSPARNKMMLNLVVPEINMDDRTLRVFHQLTSVNYNGTFDAPKLGPDQVKRIRKKKNAIAKVAESTQLLSRLSKSSKSRNSLTMLQRAKTSSTPGRSLTQMPGKSSTSHLTTQKSTNRFKTSGIVVTAVQPSNASRRNNRLRALNNTSNKPPPLPPAPSKVPQQTKTNSQQVSRVLKLPAQMVRRIKLKPKKKTLATNAVDADAAGDNVPASPAPTTAAAAEPPADDNKSKPKDTKN